VLHTIEWQLMHFPAYEYLQVFLVQGCLFLGEKILKVDQSRPNKEILQLFNKYAEFFADYSNYQSCFIKEDPYIMACGIIAYARKFVGVAVIWSHEMIVLTNCHFGQIQKVFHQLDNLYKASFPDHAHQMYYPG
jgi:hypothetical protein